MSERHTSKRLTRREFMITGAALAGAAATTPLLFGQIPMAAAQAPSGQPKTVPRNRTLNVLWGIEGTREGKWVDVDLWNPYGIGLVTLCSQSIFYEPLAFYSAFANKEVMWLAESYKYSKDYKQLTIKIRSGIKWSDGTPFSAEDVAYTFSSLIELGPKVRWGVDIKQTTEEAKATDPNTVVVKFKVPNPRFMDFVTYKYDIGVYIVPKHIYQGQDWPSFKHYDPSKDWPVTTGPWKLIFTSPEQKIIDRRDEWWAAKAGVAQMPAVERIVMRPYANEQQAVQAFIVNDADISSSVQPASFPTLLSQNPKLITHAGRKPPYGYVDWFPYSLYVNHEKPPFNDKDMRWALSYFIDRKQVTEVGWFGCAETYPLPMPNYPPLRPYVDATAPLRKKYDTLEFNPKKGEALLTKKGYKKNAQGMWVDAQGKTIDLSIIHVGTYAPMAGVVVELLKRQGINASNSMPPDVRERFFKGDYTGAIYGHGGSVRDPYYTLRLYQTATAAVPGTHLVNFPRWKNPAFDKIVDQMMTTDMNDQAKLKELFVKAMDIWLPELPDIMLCLNYHRIPMNTTYWKNWPTEDNPYLNGAFWHLTFGYLLTKIEPA
jgi:peptide/nickel transport system substrate-binding protein